MLRINLSYSNRAFLVLFEAAGAWGVMERPTDLRSNFFHKASISLFNRLFGTFILFATVVSKVKHQVVQ